MAGFPKKITKCAHRLGVKRVWVIDPIDGTKEFIEGVPQFAISIAFVVDGAQRWRSYSIRRKSGFIKRRRARRFPEQPTIRVTPRE